MNRISDIDAYQAEQRWQVFMHGNRVWSRLTPIIRHVCPACYALWWDCILLLWNFSYWHKMTVRLGNSGLKVSKIILGCMSYGRSWTVQLCLAYDKHGIAKVTLNGKRGFFPKKRLSAISRQRTLYRFFDIKYCPRRNKHEIIMIKNNDPWADCGFHCRYDAGINTFDTANVGHPWI